MKLLEEKIRTLGKVIGDDIVKVDMFLNHQVDPCLMQEMGKEFKRLFGHLEITKVLTLEVSGIAPSVFAALELGVPLVFAKKTEGRNMADDVYSADVFSFTKNKTYTVRVAKEYLTAQDKVLIIDDFLANGKAMLGMLSLVEQAGAKPQGIGVVIEKGFQKGGAMLRESGIPVQSLAIVESIENGEIRFRESDC
ncbi:MAG: xanthine phosphoribosyltransferase [Clostridia bacterium]|nr:xanthine phosphoribosyltransferase [Clostridia bacterium]